MDHFLKHKKPIELWQDWTRRAHEGRGSSFEGLREYCLRLKSVLWVFTSDVNLYLSVGGTVVRRGERPLRRHLGEITMPSRGERLFENRPGGCMLVELQIRSAVVKVVTYTLPWVLQTLQFLFNKRYMLNFSLQSLKTVKRLVVDDLCKSSQVRCAVNSDNWAFYMCTKSKLIFKNMYV